MTRAIHIAIIGGAGVRTPLLVRGLTHANLPIESIRLFDVDEARLHLVAPLAQSLAGKTPVVAAHTARECVESADYVFLSIRPGGIARRASDERIALEHNVLGQETVGAAGFSMAMRTIPEVIGYAKLIEEVAPSAWMISFTNPVGITCQAVKQATNARFIGICDTPTELFEEVAHSLGLPSRECHFDYFGLNHLGWLREVYHQGFAKLAPLWENKTALTHLYRSPLFTTEELAALKLLPTEYVYYYAHHKEAVANLKKATSTRGAVIEALNQQLFTELKRTPGDAIAIYEKYLHTRDAGYMQLESGAKDPRVRSPISELTGYDKIALSVLRAIEHNTNDIIPLNVINRGTISDLEYNDVVEVGCVVGNNGPLPLHIGAVPESVRTLLQNVKTYERATVEAAISPSVENATRALAKNPLIGSADLAHELVLAMQPLW